MYTPPYAIRAITFGVLVLTSLSGWARSQLELEDAISAAVQNDPWLIQSDRIEHALLEESVAAGALPDPRVTLGANNLPVDTFSFGQEAMTLATVGISQQIPRGRSRELASLQKSRMAEVQPLLRQHRREQVKETVSHLWLELWRTQNSIRLIEANRDLFEQLADVAEVGYTSATMGSRQQDVIRASLELTQLEDRLAALDTQRVASQAALGEWIGQDSIGLRVSEDLPPTLSASWAIPAGVEAMPVHHPSVRAKDQLIVAQATEVDLIKQAYKPEWSVFAQYGYRDSAPGGRDRANLFSVGVGFDLPIFTGNRQDRRVNASESRLEAARSERLLQVRALQSRAEAAEAVIKRLDQRIRLYRQRLLPQMEEQASAALNAYNNDDGDFAEAVRSRIAELNAQVELIQLNAERSKSLASLHYLTTRSSRAAEVHSLSITADQEL